MRVMMLHSPPSYPGMLTGIRYATLNGSMWTIAYEFRCYLLVAVLGLAGLLARPNAILAVTAFGLAMMVLVSYEFTQSTLDYIEKYHSVSYVLGSPRDTIRLTTAFMLGVCAYLNRGLLFRHLNKYMAALYASAALIFLFWGPHFAEVILLTLGGAFLFWLSFKADLGRIQTVNNRWDISYGVYLYGWPIATTILYFDRAVSPLALAAFTFPLAALCGAASWFGLEKWMKR